MMLPGSLRISIMVLYIYVLLGASDLFAGLGQLLFRFSQSTVGNLVELQT